MISGRSRTKIRAPRRGVNGDDLDFETTWNTLEVAFKQIHTQDASDLSYEELYRYAYRIVLKKQGERLYERVRDFERSWLDTVTRPAIAAFTSTSLARVSVVDGSAAASATSGERRMEGERFLKGMQENWDMHVQCMNMLSDVLMYLDRVYCTDQRKPNVYQTSMNLFRDTILFSRSSSADDAPKTITLLNGVILDQIHMERMGDIINQSPIRNCVWMLDGLFQAHAESPEHKLYNVYFENDFLDSSRLFYRAEAETLLGGSDAGAYCEKVTERLEQEQERCKQMLMESTMSKIEEVVEDELIKNKIVEVIEMENGVRFMVDNDRMDDLHRVYKLERRVDRKTTKFTEAIQSRIVAMGEGVNNAANSSPQADPTQGEGAAAGVKGVAQQTTAAIKWVGDVLSLKDKFDRIMNQSCEGDNELQASMTRSFSKFVNASTFGRASEYISLFIDDNMKRGIKDKAQDEVDLVLHKAIVLLRYVQDKDMFEGYYKKHLAKRLLMTKSLDLDVEKEMVARMKIDFGNQFTQKLEAMFKDMDISKELTNGYREHIQGLGATDQRTIDLGIHILTSLTWPDMSKNYSQSDSGQHLQCKLPSEMKELQSSFENYYLKKHNGRKLDWFMNLGSVDLSARFNRKYEVNVPTYGMVVLALFNKHKSLRLEEIQAETNIPKPDLERALISLSVAPKTRLLKKEPMSARINAKDMFSVNEAFTSKFIKIKVGLITSGNRVENDKEHKETEEKLAEMRRHTMEAAIVRIMKQRKELSHQNLITETIYQLKARFKPDVPMIKGRIDSLIDREYLERIEDSSPSMYRYLA